MLSEQEIRDNIGKRIKVNVGNMIIEGLLGYYGQPRYTNIASLPSNVREFLDQGNQMHLFDLKFFYLDGREIPSDKKGVGYYVLKVNDFPNLDVQIIE